MSFKIGDVVGLVKSPTSKYLELGKKYPVVNYDEENDNVTLNIDGTIKSFTGKQFELLQQKDELLETIKAEINEDILLKIAEIIETNNKEVGNTLEAIRSVLEDVKKKAINVEERIEQLETLLENPIIKFIVRLFAKNKK